MRFINLISPKKVSTCSILSVECICIVVYGQNYDYFEIYENKYLVFSKFNCWMSPFEKVDRGFFTVKLVLNNS